MAGQVKVPAGQVNLRDSLSCLEDNVLLPMLHPVVTSRVRSRVLTFLILLRWFKLEDGSKCSNKYGYN